MENREIYDLELNNSLVDEGMRIIRVPGGWIYKTISQTNNTSVFVPFNDEFSKTKVKSTQSNDSTKNVDHSLKNIKDFCEQQINQNQKYCEINSCEPTGYMHGVDFFANQVIKYIKKLAPWLEKE
jgi:soluble cytochrome b562